MTPDPDDLNVESPEDFAKFEAKAEELYSQQRRDRALLLRVLDARGLSEWEMRTLTAMNRQDLPLSEQQVRLLYRIAERLNL